MHITCSLDFYIAGDDPIIMQTSNSSYRDYLYLLHLYITFLY